MARCASSTSATGNVRARPPDATTARWWRPTFSADGRLRDHRRRGRAGDRLGRQAGGGRRDAGGPRRPDHRTGDQPRQPDALHHRPRRQGPRLGSRRRPPPRSPVRPRTGQPGGDAPLRAEPRRPRPRGRTRRRHGQPDRRPDAAGDLRPSAVVADGPADPGMGYVPGGRCSSSAATTGSSPWSTRPPADDLKQLHGHRERIFTPSFSADGRLMASASGWTRRRRRASGRCRRADPVGRRTALSPRFRLLGDMSLSPDGRTLAVTGSIAHHQRGVEIVDVATHRRRTSLSQAETVTDLARFTPDGRFIVGGSSKGWARLWSTKTWRPATPQRSAGTPERWSGSRPARTAARSPPAERTANIRLWDLRTQQPLGAPLPALPNHYADPTVHPRRRLPVRHHQRRTRLPLGRAPALMGAARLRRGRPHAHPDRVERRTARARLRAGVRPLSAGPSRLHLPTHAHSGRHAVVGVAAELVPASSKAIVPAQRVRAKLKLGPQFLPARRESKFGREASAIPTTAINIRKLRTSGERGVPAETARFTGIPPSWAGRRARLKIVVSPVRVRVSPCRKLG